MNSVIKLLMCFVVGVFIEAEGFAQSPTPPSELFLKKEITVGDLLTILTILLSVIGAFLGLLLSSVKDQQLKRKEYADRIRRASGTIIAKLERWKELSLRYYEDIQPLLTDADILLIDKKDVIATRDYLWRHMVDLKAKTSQRIMDEEIEVAYADLYGYDPRIHSLYVSAVRNLKKTERQIYMDLLQETQQDVLDMKDNTPIFSSKLGNALRGTCNDFGQALADDLDKEIELFRNEMIKLIEASDKEIVKKAVNVSPPIQDLPKVTPPE